MTVGRDATRPGRSRVAPGRTPTRSPAVSWSTSVVPPDDAFDYWRDLICDAFVQLSARPAVPGPFLGSLEHHTVGDVALSLVSADGQRVDRTRTLIARSHEDYLLASIQLEGRGRVHQEGRDATLVPGAMAFYDSARPYTLSFRGPFRQLVVQVPKTLTGTPTAGATAVALGAHGPGRPVADFFVRLAREQGPAPASLVPHALGLLDFALRLAAGAARPTTWAARSEDIRATVERAAVDPDADADAIAAACHVSRRTLFRVLAEDGETVAGLLRRARLRRAQVLLRAQPSLPVAVVAARSGFAGPAQLHRAFRAATGTTPGAYRTTG